jgi:hypothetical protein
MPVPFSIRRHPGWLRLQKWPASAIPLLSALTPTRLVAVLSSLARTLAFAAPTVTAAPSAPSAPAEFPEKEAFFGETHIHTATSFDPLRPRGACGGERPALSPPAAARLVRRH